MSHAFTSQVFLDMAASAAQRGYPVLSRYYQKLSHDAAVGEARAQSAALTVIAAARRNVEAEYRDAKDAEDREAQRLVCVDTPQWLPAALVVCR